MGRLKEYLKQNNKKRQSIKSHLVGFEYMEQVRRASSILAQHVLCNLFVAKLRIMFFHTFWTNTVTKIYGRMS